MTPVIVFEWDSRDLAIWRGGKVEGALQRALRLAGNQALRVMERESEAHVLGRKRMREVDVRTGMPLVFPNRKAAIRDLVWRQKVSGKPVALSKFPYIQTRRGVNVRVNVDGSTRRIAHAFAVVMPKSGHLGVFVRKDRRRLPIQQLWTTRISDVMQDEGAIPKVQDKAQSKLQSAFAKGLTREMKKLVRKGEA